MNYLRFKVEEFVDNYLKIYKELTNVKFKVKESEEDIGSIEILYIINKDDDAEIRKEIYDIISNIVYNDFENKGFTENEINNILISYDYFNEIEHEIKLAEEELNSIIISTYEIYEIKESYNIKELFEIFPIESLIIDEYEQSNNSYKEVEEMLWAA